jgi:signal recognition particle GTPase
MDSIEEYLEYVGRGRGSAFGRRYRSQFRDMRGTAELAMLAAPSEEEYADFSRAISVMTDEEKTHPENLSDDEIREIAQRCGAASGNISIFVNGYVLARKQEQACQINKDKES